MKFKLTFILLAIVFNFIGGSIIDKAAANNAENPQIVWRQIFSNLRSEPVIHDRNIISIQDTSILAADFTIGKVIWRTDFSSRLSSFKINNSNNNLHFSPIVVSNKILIVEASCNNSSKLLAFESHKGRFLWMYDPSSMPLNEAARATRGLLLSTPVFWRDRIIVRTGRGLTAISQSKGSEIWNVPLDPYGNVPFTPSAQPAVSNNMIYFNADFGIAYAFDPRDGHCVWERPTPGIHVTDSGNVRKVEITLAYCSPLLLDKRLIVADGVGNILALNSINGEILWQSHIGSTHQLLAGGDVIYASTENGLTELDIQTGKLRRDYTIKNGVPRCVINQGYGLLTINPS